jgi:hypothetical protein
MHLALADLPPATGWLFPRNRLRSRLPGGGWWRSTWWGVEVPGRRQPGAQGRCLVSWTALRCCDRAAATARRGCSYAADGGRRSGGLRPRFLSRDWQCPGLPRGVFASCATRGAAGWWRCRGRRGGPQAWSWGRRSWLRLACYARSRARRWRAVHARRGARRGGQRFRGGRPQRGGHSLASSSSICRRPRQAAPRALGCGAGVPANARHGSLRQWPCRVPSR